MQRSEWSAPTGKDEACRRAAGRRHFNAVRKFRQALRRQQVAQLLTIEGFDRGALARIARKLGVHRSTIWRDFKALDRPLFCPTCRRMLPSVAYDHASEPSV